jgi:hypothetical protein
MIWYSSAGAIASMLLKFDFSLSPVYNTLVEKPRGAGRVNEKRMRASFFSYMGDSGVLSRGEYGGPSSSKRLLFRCFSVHSSARYSLYQSFANASCFTGGSLVGDFDEWGVFFSFK